eukprot:CAMPEP_0184686134 /NCGR_PEP_ID=MMETSP0312-20130426/21399_1 /TAXON_ID=31354 /ORGANISM="Compsopogon coeruleus, Strain SAG 36.94" /LENGTH=61 /DNA_ID=CAMNT_0027140911 /DNA_START=78 /DNA_END=259 /DNA_ORIENTATION=+
MKGRIVGKAGLMTRRMDPRVRSVRVDSNETFRSAFCPVDEVGPSTNRVEPAQVLLSSMRSA